MRGCELLMKSDIKFLLRVIGSIISGTNLPKEPENVDWHGIYRICRMHSIANLMGYVVSTGEYNIPQDIKQMFIKKLYEAVAVNENQQKAFLEIFRFFDDMKIDYMPLKGLNLKKIYASCDMRNMSDGDILIKVEQFEEIDRIMKKLGYSFKLESNHEYVYQKPPCINVELHKFLIPSYNYDLYGYYGNGWKLANKIDETSRYEFNKEDEFIYIFTHYAKHYRDGGVGIKYLADIWLYTKKYSIDIKYVAEEFEKLGLKTFYENTFRLLKVWFDDMETDELIDLMTEYIIFSGEYGNEKNAVIATEIRENQGKNIEEVNKTKKIRLVFPSLIHMRKGYPVLRKYSFLLPVFWGVRIVKFLLCSKASKDILEKKNEYITEENLYKFDKHMKAVGLDIYNGRIDK